MKYSFASALLLILAPENVEAGSKRTRQLSTGEASQWTQIGGDIDGENVWDFAGGTQGALAMNDQGTTLVVGASGHDIDGGVDGGHTRVFDLSDDGVWKQRGEDIQGEFGKLHPSFAGDNSGSSVVLSADGNVVGIGEPNSEAGKYPCEDPSDCAYTKFDRDFGQVRVFEWKDGAWLQRGRAVAGAARGDFASEAGGLGAEGRRHQW